MLSDTPDEDTARGLLRSRSCRGTSVWRSCGLAAMRSRIRSTLPCRPHSHRLDDASDQAYAWSGILERLSGSSYDAGKFMCARRRTKASSGAPLRSFMYCAMPSWSTRDTAVVFWAQKYASFVFEDARQLSSCRQPSTGTRMRPSLSVHQLGAG